MTRQPWPSPNFAPGIARDQILELRIQIALQRLCPIDVRVAQNIAPHKHPCRMPLSFIHCEHPPLPGTPPLPRQILSLAPTPGDAMTPTPRTLHFAAPE